MITLLRMIAGLTLLGITVRVLLEHSVAAGLRGIGNPLSMFHDDDGSWSMTRVIALMFAYRFCQVIPVLAKQDHLHDIRIPLAIVFGITLLTVPIQALCKALIEWFKSTPGMAVLKKLGEAAGPMLAKAAGSHAAAPAAGNE